MDHVPETIEYGISSLAYRAVAPFHPQRLWDLLSELDTFDVVRSKGFLWLATRPDVLALWSQAGPSARCDLAAVPVASSGQWPDDPADRADLESRWDPIFGDRRQERCLIILPRRSSGGCRGSVCSAYVYDSAG
ncbi:cobalamin biosynthesis protein CobW [Natronosporangium hydrolyticum]|uniref:Cobalamin biosynthesis protein CobW n=1 Tax=Natronosporangium hydrolyticum TaxID=2811111 RepID=A0A895YQE2_9ACTN|nr:cobalamin biosynthesis protein CobW [Natronosporangium hydrolyticum]